jgi:hypothetical protein
MAKTERPRVPSPRNAERRWLTNTIAGLKRYQDELLTKLRDLERADTDDDAAVQAQLARLGLHELTMLPDQVAHVHHDLVAIRAKLDIPNPGCAPAEEHTEA